MNNSFLQKTDQLTRRDLRKGDKLVYVAYYYPVDLCDPSATNENRVESAFNVSDALKQAGIDPVLLSYDGVYAKASLEQAKALIESPDVKRLHTVRTPKHRQKYERIANMQSTINTMIARITLG